MFKRGCKTQVPDTQCMVSLPKLGWLREVKRWVNTPHELDIWELFEDPKTSWQKNRQRIQVGKIWLAKKNRSMINHCEKQSYSPKKQGLGRIWKIIWNFQMLFGVAKVCSFPCVCVCVYLQNFSRPSKKSPLKRRAVWSVRHPDFCPKIFATRGEVDSTCGELGSSLMDAAVQPPCVGNICSLESVVGFFGVVQLVDCCWF